MDPSRRLWPRSDLRVGDSDRKTVVDELQRHYIEGRLTSEELGERVSRALSARTFGDLSSLLSDLPAPADANNVDAQPDLDAYDHHQWRTHTMVPPMGIVLLVLGLIFIVMMFAMPMGRYGFVFPWPLLIWGFFFISRPWRGGGRRF